MDDLTRREFTGVTITAVALAGTLPESAVGAPTPHLSSCSVTVNGKHHDVKCDARVTLLDLLREQLHLTGTKKGCDHGQCGACTVLVNGVRVNSCLLLAVTQDGNEVTTIEGLGAPGALHPLQAAFIEHDGFQCGFCTSGQICSAAGMLQEWRSGKPSAVTAAARLTGTAELTDGEIRERMAGNICRCGAYPNIVAAIRETQREGPRG